MSKGAVARAEKAAKHPIYPFQPRMNKIRKMLMDKIRIALVAHEQRENVGDMRFMHEAIDFNQEFVDRSRGKGKARGKYIKSVANQRNRTTYFPPEKRNGNKECQRRL